MVLDSIKNFAISTVATAPSPATTGTSLVVDGGHGARFPLPLTEGAFNAIIFPEGEQPDSSNAEIVRVTARSTDTFTITRQQEGTSARTIVVGDIVMLGLTAKGKQDILTWGSRKKAISRGSHHGMVTFYFDDGPDTDYSVLRPLFSAQGEVGAICIITDLADGGGGNSSWAEINTMVGEGWEVVNHSTAHDHLTGFTEAQLETDIADSMTAFATNGLYPTNYAYPYNGSNELVRRIIRKYFRSARGGGALPIVNDKALDTYNLDSVEMDDWTKIATFKALADQAYRTNTWLCFYGHSSGYDAGEQTALGTLIDYIQALGLPIVTPTEALDYMENYEEFGDSLGIGEGKVRLTAQTIYPEFQDTGGAGTVVANTAVGAGDTIELGTAGTASVTFTQALTMSLTAGTIMFEMTPSESSVDPSFLYDATTGYYIRWRGSLTAFYFYQDATHLATFSTTVPNVDAKKTHVAFVMGSNSKVSCYVDGTLINENATVFTVAPKFTNLRNTLTTTSLLFGNIRVWSGTSLTQQEIWNEMYSPYAVKTAGLTQQFKGNCYLGTAGVPTKFANIKQFDLFLK
jgi:peptidoglycan/xylan/chitin deacetylase (PgdA/CDA1 family)